MLTNKSSTDFVQVTQNHDGPSQRRNFAASPLQASYEKETSDGDGHVSAESVWVKRPNYTKDYYVGW